MKIPCQVDHCIRSHGLREYWVTRFEKPWSFARQEYLCRLKQVDDPDRLEPAKQLWHFSTPFMQSWLQSTRRPLLNIDMIIGKVLNCMVQRSIFFPSPNAVTRTRKVTDGSCYPHNLEVPHSPNSMVILVLVHFTLSLLAGINFC